MIRKQLYQRPISYMFSTLALLFVVGFVLGNCAQSNSDDLNNRRSQLCGNRECGATEYCEYADKHNCGYWTTMGACKTRPEVCTQEYLPVCGCDGKVYSNECEANRVGVTRNRGLSSEEQELKVGEPCRVMVVPPTEPK